ncbi:MAG TPA: hypothetical protein IAC46_00450 [Candidatus Onthoplasma faecigallinarum]|nr:hypothetical protein [Candidatus Onthoplasma faecigallinarum]
MKKITKDINKIFVISLIVSVLFVVGIPLIAVFAGKNWILMTLGIIFVVVGFYGSPLLWVNYAGKRKTRRIVEAIEEENLYSNAEIASQLSIKEKEVKQEIYKAINKKYLTGYIYDGEKISSNNKQKQTQALHIKKCNNCGGKLEIRDDKWYCPYCEMTFTFEEIK